MTDGWPELLLALAGRIPDEAVTAARGAALATDTTERVARIVAGAHQVGARLSAADLLGLVEALVVVAEPGDADSAAELLEARGDLPLTDYRFQPLRPTVDTDLATLDGSGAPDTAEGASTAVDLSRTEHQHWLDPVALAAVGVASAEPEVTALWGVWRQVADHHDAENSRASRVFLVETSSGGLPAPITIAFQRGLAAVGEGCPRVEVLGPATRPASYQRAGLAAAALLWISPSSPAPQLVGVFDGLNGSRAPWFHPAHPRLVPEERPRVAAYLYCAEPLLLTTATMADVVDPVLGGPVPLNFRTDGAYIWPDAVAYYADRHGLSPRPPLLAAIRSAGYRSVPLTRVQRFRAERVLFEAV